MFLQQNCLGMEFDCDCMDLTSVILDPRRGILIRILVETRKGVG